MTETKLQKYERSVPRCANQSNGNEIKSRKDFLKRFIRFWLVPDCQNPLCVTSGRFGSKKAVTPFITALTATPSGHE
ncbi:MAG: hypothetical protein FWG90_11535 [Oscillospiraceae bacterium]|nr:hypothetical protein [Oscillospiraceae bacterium]